MLRKKKGELQRNLHFSGRHAPLRTECWQHVNIQVTSCQVSDGNVEDVIGTWKKGNPCYKEAKNLAKMFSSVLWKIELVSDGQLPEIYKQNVEDPAWFFPAVYSERDKLKKELFSKKEPELEDLKNPHPLHIAKK